MKRQETIQRIYNFNSDIGLSGGGQERRSEFIKSIKLVPKYTKYPLYSAPRYRVHTKPEICSQTQPLLRVRSQITSEKISF